MANRAIASFVSNLRQNNRKVGEFVFGGSYHRQLGLLSDDQLNETAAVKEALRRLPLRLQDERMYRLTRAIQLSAIKQILPKEEWVQPENDKSYLQPYLQQVMKEEREKQDWYKQ
ncbi:hypothetical protein CAPTEDRAFT_222274 [Capitella teleta]|uniref:Cytochrome b-c1 complex subunit 7 n=1 Tax=Capitella teleta TaxID=283909 RepID=R7TU04_CAPTE|nr:hypothetical protein CAPTEDRAFT_222274 [Capitella teleta]|eukprot:ELT97159.1 hypothetical protein CAPTEDRAFT_222274 [Capitella teleta]